MTPAIALDRTTLGLAASASAIAFFHAVLPTHWLPFALVGRAQGWRPGRVALVAAAGAAGHALMTAGVGFGIALIGLEIAERLERAELLGGLVLVAFGVFYAGLDVRHLGHRHQAEREGKVHSPPPPRLGNRAAVASLVLPLSISPCIALSPIFFHAGEIGLSVAALIAAVNAAVTVPVMIVMAALAARGMESLRLERIERFERFFVGLLLVGIGVAAIVLHGPHAHGAR